MRYFAECCLLVGRDAHNPYNDLQFRLTQRLYEQAPRYTGKTERLNGAARPQAQVPTLLRTSAKAIHSIREDGYLYLRRRRNPCRRIRRLRWGTCMQLHTLGCISHGPRIALLRPHTF